MPDVYDKEEDQLNRDDAVVPHNLNDITGISPEQEAAHDREAHSGAARDIAEREGLFNPKGDESLGAGSEPKALSGAGLAAAEAGAAGSSGLFNSAGGAGSPGGKIRQLVRGKGGRRSAITGGIAGTVLGGFLFAGTILSGPAQLIHLAHILQSPFGNEQSASDGRTGKLIRWAKTRDYGETRLGLLGSRINKRVQADFAERGVSFTSDQFGLIRTVSVDATKDPRYQNMTPEEARAAIAADNGLSSVNQISENKYAFNIGDSKITAQRAVIKNFVREQGYGKIMSAIKFRQLTKYFNVPSWLHPLNRTAAEVDKKLANTDFVKNYIKKQTDKLTARSEAAKARNAVVKEKLKGTAGVAGAFLTGAAVICVAKDIAHQIPILNYDNKVAPAIQSGVSLMSVGEDMAYGSQNGSTPSMKEAGAIVSGFTDANGNSLWESAPLNSMQGLPGGTDLNQSDKQAFSPNSNSAQLEAGIDSVGGAELCSNFGQVLTGVAAIALLAAGPAGWVVTGLKTAASVAAITAVTSLAPKLLADSSPNGTPHEGPNGGSIDAYGVREAANTAYRNDGGVSMDPGQTAVLDSQQQAEKQAKNKSESIATRLLDPYNENSPVGHALNQLTPSYSHNIATIASSLPKIGTGIFSNLSSILMPKAHAATADTSYDWPFPEYAFSQNELDAVDNPYDNGQAVAQLLDSQGPDSPYVSRAHACFGVKLSKGADGLWDAIADSDTNPATNEYISANCKDSDPNWLKVRMFVFDTRTATALDCYEGSGDSCQTLGTSTGNASASAGSSIGATQWPFKPDANANIIQCFTIHSGGTHPGLDIDTPRGTPIYSITAGTVNIAPDPAGYGPNYVLINPDSSSGYGSSYGHMDTATVTNNQVVKIGDQVGTEGSQGASTGPHLHLNLFQGPSRGDPNNIDPMQALKVPAGSTNGAGCT
jgi:murein DD-endopeptidase MepM/ murein hydrolase activator NlpD